MEKTTKIWFDSGTEDFSFSLCKQDYVIVDGESVPLGQQHREAIMAGDFERLHAFVYGNNNQPRGRNAVEHPIITVLRGIWTDEIIESFKEKQAKHVTQLNEG